MFYTIKRKTQKNPKETGYERLRNALVADKASATGKLHRVIKSDFYSMITNYMDARPESIRVDVDCDGNGNYNVFIKASASRIFDIGLSPPVS